MYVGVFGVTGRPPSHAAGDCGSR